MLDGRPLAEAIDELQLIDEWSEVSWLNNWGMFCVIRVSGQQDYSTDSEFGRSFIGSPLLNSLRAGELSVRATRLGDDSWSSATEVTIPAGFWWHADFLISRNPPELVELGRRARDPALSRPSIYFANPTIHAGGAARAPLAQRRQESGADQMEEAQQKLQASGDIKPDMSLKEQHRIICRHLDVRDSRYGYGYENFARLRRRSKTNK